MPELTHPAAPDETGLEADWTPFRVANAAEIGALMRQLHDNATPLLLGAPDGSSLVTQLWSLDLPQQRLHLGADARDPALQTLIAADEAVAVCYLDDVKLQFDLHQLLLVHGTDNCTLQAALPRQLYRFQRRDSYRVRTPDRLAPTARLRHTALPDMLLALRMIDISIGGCALFLPADVPQLEPGLSLHGVQIDLDVQTRFNGALQILHVGSIGSQDGLRAGCEWLNLPPEAARALQRYIDQTQKRQRMLALS
jgi:c-di-GMP-binding flagellar brake protein YcgR